MEYSKEIASITMQQFHDAIFPHVSYVLNDLGRMTGEAWNVPLTIRCTTKRKGSVHRFRNKNGKAELIFGEYSLRSAMQYGHTEYRQLQWLVRSGRYKGIMAVYIIATHELAHYVHISRARAGKTQYRKPHDSYYAAVYQELLSNYPYDVVRSHYLALEAHLSGAKFGTYRQSQAA